MEQLQGKIGGSKLTAGAFGVVSVATGNEVVAIVGFVVFFVGVVLAGLQADRAAKAHIAGGN